MVREQVRQVGHGGLAGQLAAHGARIDQHVQPQPLGHGGQAARHQAGIDVADAVRYTRAPWGEATDDATPRFRLIGAASAGSARRQSKGTRRIKTSADEGC